jgi:hypothetical protein
MEAGVGSIEVGATSSMVGVLVHAARVPMENTKRIIL